MSPFMLVSAKSNTPDSHSPRCFTVFSLRGDNRGAAALMSSEDDLTAVTSAKPTFRQNSFECIISDKTIVNFKVGHQFVFLDHRKVCSDDIKSWSIDALIRYLLSQCNTLNMFPVWLPKVTHGCSEKQRLMSRWGWMAKNCFCLNQQRVKMPHLPLSLYQVRPAKCLKIPATRITCN